MVLEDFVYHKEHIMLSNCDVIEKQLDSEKTPFSAVNKGFGATINNFMCFFCR